MVKVMLILVIKNALFKCNPGRYVAPNTTEPVVETPRYSKILQKVRTTVYEWIVKLTLNRANDIY